MLLICIFAPFRKEVKKKEVCFAGWFRRVFAPALLKMRRKRAMKEEKQRAKHVMKMKVE